MTTQSFKLVMRSGPIPGQVYELSKDVINIGRSTGSDIIINDAEISRNHARLTLQGGEYMIEDLESTNGTFINGQRLIGPHLLRAGESIALGEKVTLEAQSVFDEDATIVPPPTVPVDKTSMPPAEQTLQEQPQSASQPSPPPTYPLAQEEQAVPIPPAETYPLQQTEQTAQTAPVAQPVYSQPVQQQIEPEETFYEEDKVSINWTWIFAGCGCVSVLACITVVAALFWIDAGGVDRWCQFLGFLFPGSCP